MTIADMSFRYFRHEEVSISKRARILESLEALDWINSEKEHGKAALQLDQELEEIIMSFQKSHTLLALAKFHRESFSYLNRTVSRQLKGELVPARNSIISTEQFLHVLDIYYDH